MEPPSMVVGNLQYTPGVIPGVAAPAGESPLGSGGESHCHRRTDKRPHWPTRGYHPNHCGESADDGKLSIPQPRYLNWDCKQRR